MVGSGQLRRRGEAEIMSSGPTADKRPRVVGMQEDPTSSGLEHMNGAIRGDRHTRIGRARLWCRAPGYVAGRPTCPVRGPCRNLDRRPDRFKLRWPRICFNADYAGKARSDADTAVTLVLWRESLSRQATNTRPYSRSSALFRVIRVARDPRRSSFRDPRRSGYPKRTFATSMRMMKAQVTLFVTIKAASRSRMP